MSAPVIIGLVVGSIVVGGTLVEVSSGLEARHRADAVAENAALAAADAHFGWIDADPCTLATRVAEHSDAILVGCTLGDFDLFVSVRTNTLLGERIGRARAGVRSTIFDAS